MNATEALDTIDSWKRILVEGEPKRIDSMLEKIERKLEDKGWSRRPDLEARMGRSPDRPDRFRCFVGGPQNGPQLMLGLTRVSERRIRGGSFSFISPGEATEVTGIIKDVVRNVIIPSAADLGLKVTSPRLGSVSQVPPKTKSYLDLFSDLAAGSWPLSAEMDRAWQRFVATACREGAAFDVDELMAWFVANGWNPDDARMLTDRFLSEAALIAEYRDE